MISSLFLRSRSVYKNFKRVVKNGSLFKACTSQQANSAFFGPQHKTKRKRKCKWELKSHGARPVQQITSMIKLIRTSSLSMTNSLSTRDFLHFGRYCWEHPVCRSISEVRAHNLDLGKLADPLCKGHPAVHVEHVHPSLLLRVWGWG